MLGGIYTVVRADECDPSSITDPNDPKITQCIGKYQGILEAISKANSNNLQELKGLQTQVANLQWQIGGLDKQLIKLTEDIFDREVKVGVRQELLTAKVKQDYIRKRDQPMLLLLFSSDNAAQFFQDLAYREKLARNDRDIIASVSGEISNLNTQTENMKQQKALLASIRERADKQASFLAGEIEKANKYVSDLGGKISAITARQQQLLAQRNGMSSTSVGDVPLADDPASRPDYNPGFSPAFAGFSFGAPHFKGMSQYGAFGRAKAGQSVEEILRAYYGGGIEIKKDYSTGTNIRVQGYGTVDIETYVKRIYEMPASWGDDGGMEALKAQAVAARSYALAYTNNGAGSICATEACQVYKPANKGGKWDEAVNATRGWVLIANGKPFSAWYASTSGGYQQAYTANGYTTPGFWDTTSDWTHWAQGAWEVKGGSPWFYKGWYRSREGSSCGRSSPWLKENEFADIVNAAIVVANGGDVSGILPEDVRSCLGGSDNPWPKDRLASEADKYGGRVTSVSGIRVNHSQGGYTAQIIISSNRGEVTISGENFKKAFNLRAPGMLSVKGDLFNIERK
jgi:hypothetical protein